MPPKSFRLGSAGVRRGALIAVIALGVAVAVSAACVMNRESDAGRRAESVVTASPVVAYESRTPTATAIAVAIPLATTVGTATPISSATPTPVPNAPTATPASVAPGAVTPTPISTPPPPTPPTPAATNVAAPSPVTASTPRPTTDVPKSGGTLNLEAARDIAHQDVHRDVSPALAAWGPGVAYSRLLRLESGPGADTPSLALECDLCQDWTMESPTSYLFTLRPDARWQNLAPVWGRRVTSDDVIFSYARQSYPDFPNSALLRNVESVEALDPATLRVRFALPDADALLSLADGHSKIVAREAVEASGDLLDGPTIGSGAWILEQTAPGDMHSFARNPDYFEPGLPLADRLRFLILTDEVTRAAAFQTGITDVHMMAPEEWSEYSAHVSNPPALMARQPGDGIEVAFKTTEPPFDSLQVRRAAMLSMEPFRIIEEQAGGFGFVSGGFPVASPEWMLPDSELGELFRGTEYGNALLRYAGVDALAPVVITVGDFGKFHLDYAHAVSATLQGIGIETEVEIVNRRLFGEDVWLEGDYQMMVGPPAPVSSPNGYLLPVLHSGGRWNTTGHSDPTLDALLEAQAVEYDARKRAELAREIQSRVLDQAYRFMPFARIAIWTWNPRVRDVHPNFGASEYHHWTRAWIND